VRASTIGPLPGENHLRETVSVPPYKPMPIRVPRVQCTHRVDGSSILQTDYVLPEPRRSIVHLFIERARQFPDRRFIARRRSLPGNRWGDWDAISYRDAERDMRAIAQALIDRGCGPDASVMVLSGASIEHGLLMMGAHAARAAYAPISTGYSLLSNDFAKLRHAFEICQPKIIFADDGPAYEAALKALLREGVTIVTVNPPRDLPAVEFAELLATTPTAAVETSIDAIAAETHAKTIFTSGSTGAPKGVIHTHGMLMASLGQHEAITLPEESPDGPNAQLSWLPWSHLGGTNTRFLLTIYDASTLYIDEGRPVPGECEESMRNLREIALTDFASPPALFGYLVAAMEQDEAFRDFFFSKLRFMAYGSAALSQDIFERLQALAVAATGYRIPVITRYGATEAGGVTLAPWPLEEMGPIGVPNAGVTVKLAPCGDVLELRVRGACVTPGYLRDGQATARAFDDEGFFCTGDAARLVDPLDPSRGLFYAGRVNENFKLSSGTWVAVGPLRTSLVSALGIVQDCVIAGHNRDDLRALAWLRNAEAAAVAQLPANAQMRDLIRSPRVLEELSARLRAYNDQAGGASRRIRRVLLMHEPPTVDELAEKGYINQGATLRRRKPLVDSLYSADEPLVVAEATN
jgi:feruloyl-CoA synthase